MAPGTPSAPRRHDVDLEIETADGWQTVPGIDRVQVGERPGPVWAVRLFDRDYWWDRLPDGRLTLRPLLRQEQP